MASVLCQNGCKPVRTERRYDDTNVRKRAYFEKYDLGKLREIESKPIPSWYPTGFDMTSFSRYQRDALWLYDVKEIRDMFTKRNLWGLALIKSGSVDAALQFILSSILMNSSRIYRHRDFGGGGPKGTDFMIPQVGREIPVWPQFLSKFSCFLSAIHDIPRSSWISISTQSASDMRTIKSAMVDYIFTDPPYFGTVQYGELSSIWCAWLGYSFDWMLEELIVSDARGKTEADCCELLQKSMAECYRVLKPGRWLSLCYHDTSEGTWELIQDIMAEVGFIADKTDTALFIDTGQKSYNQLTADKATKRDLVINFRKPKSMQFAVTKIYSESDLEGLSPDFATFRDYASQLIRDYLIKRPGATKDRIYDELVSQLVSSRSMESHDFEALLRSVADEVQEPVKKNLFENKEPDLFGSHIQSRWYLKETADHVDQAEQAKEDAVAVRLATYITDYLQKKPEAEGVHYSDLFEQFLPVNDKPRRLLADWLPEYFIKTASGTWRNPNSDESQQLATLREQGTLRRIKRFANALIEGVPIRDKDRPASDSDLLDWLRQCRRAGLYEQGKSIYDKGGLNAANLTDEQQIETEDDYRICTRRGSSEEAKPKRKKRKSEEDT